MCVCVCCLQVRKSVAPLSCCCANAFGIIKFFSLLSLICAGALSPGANLRNFQSNLSTFSLPLYIRTSCFALLFICGFLLLHFLISLLFFCVERLIQVAHHCCTYFVEAALLPLLALAPTLHPLKQRNKTCIFYRCTYFISVSVFFCFFFLLSHKLTANGTWWRWVLAMSVSSCHYLSVKAPSRHLFACMCACVRVTLLPHCHAARCSLLLLPCHVTRSQLKSIKSIKKIPLLLLPVKCLCKWHRLSYNIYIVTYFVPRVCKLG